MSTSPHTRSARSTEAVARSVLVVLFGAAVLMGCAGDPLGTGENERTFDNTRCALEPDFLQGVVPPGFIPSLELPTMVAADVSPDDEPNAEYLSDDDRVLGIVIDGEARAYPHRVLEQHEIVNDRVGDRWITVTYCPLTGSGLAFDPHVGGARLELGVSGLLFANNLVLYDRATGDLYGPQLTVEGRCDAFRNQSMSMLPVQETSWGRWKHYHPDTKVIGIRTTDDRYDVNLYAGYGDLDNYGVWYPGPVDTRRPPKERVLAIRSGDGGPGYPFGALATLGETAVVNETIDGVPTAVLYRAHFGETAVAYDAQVDGQTLELEVDGIGVWRDVQSGSRWTIDGVAFDGPLAGRRLEPRAEAYVAYWFAWRHFQPEGSPFGG